jgi:threonine synthase
MDISKASNFERFVFDLLGRDAQRTYALFKQELDRSGAFTLTAAEFARIGDYGFVSGSSTHADRLATIRDTHARFGSIIDTHTADGLKVGRDHLTPGVATIVLETALPAKFAETIVEAIGREPDRPAAMRGIEQLPKRFVEMTADVQAVKRFIAEND